MSNDSPLPPTISQGIICDEVQRQSTAIQHDKGKQKGSLVESTRPFRTKYQRKSRRRRSRGGRVVSTIIGVSRRERNDGEKGKRSNYRRAKRETYDIGVPVSVGSTSGSVGLDLSAGSSVDNHQKGCHNGEEQYRACENGSSTEFLDERTIEESRQRVFFRDEENRAIRRASE